MVMSEQKRPLQMVSAAMGLMMAGTAVMADDSFGLPVAEPETVGISSERLARIRPAMQPFIDEGKVPGVLTVIARHGKVVHVEAQGYADIEAKKPLSTDGIYRLYSMTKPITGVAVMMMYEQGKFGLDDEIADYLPEFRHMKVCTDKGLVDAKRPITIRMLLTHTAGMTYKGLIPNLPCEVEESESLIRLTTSSLEQGVKDLAASPLVAQPGEKWTYGEAMRVLARLVEVVSGQKYSEFLQQNIFDPLKMVDTGYTVPKAKGDRLVTIYDQSAGGLKKGAADNYGGDYTETARFEGGGAGLAGTAADYVRFAQMLLNGGELDGVRLLSPTSVKLMMSNHLPPSIKLGGLPTIVTPGVGFGLTGMIITDAVAAGFPGANGMFTWGGWANTDFWIDPKEDLISLVFTQVIPTKEQLVTRPKMYQMTYQAIVGE